MKSIEKILQEQSEYCIETILYFTKPELLRQKSYDELQQIKEAVLPKKED